MTKEKSKDKNHKGIVIRPISLLILIIASIFASATVVDLILSVFSPLSINMKQSLMNAVLMVIMLFPVMYYLVYEPLTSSIKDLHRSEEALQESEAKFRSLVETTDDSIYLVNRKCEYLLMNAKHRSRLGIVMDHEYEGKAYGDFHSPEETGVFNEEVNRVFESGEPLQHEHRSRRDGKYFLRTLSPIKGPHNDVVGVSVVSKDITRLMKEGEAELRYRAVFDQSPSGISTGKRQETRHNCYFPVEFALKDAVDKTVKAVVLNFSDSGLCINSSIPLNRGQKIIMKGSIPTRHHVFTVQWSSALMAGLFAQLGATG
jgi:PAS domain S-box-containing protein